jgi:putative glutathione S-transferase
MSSVRRTYLLPIALVAAVAIGLRQYLQTGNESKITDWVSPHDKTGEFKRGQSAFRNFISGEPGGQFPPEKDRYHLYVSYACPWGMSSKLCFTEDETDLGSLRQHTGHSSCAS